MTEDLAERWHERQELARELLEYGEHEDWDPTKFDAECARLTALDDEILAAEARTVEEVLLQIRALLASLETGGRDYTSGLDTLGEIADRLEAIAAPSGGLAKLWFRHQQLTRQREELGDGATDEELDPINVERYAIEERILAARSSHFADVVLQAKCLAFKVGERGDPSAAWIATQLEALAGRAAA